MSPDPDRHITRTGDDYAEAMQALLPLGQAWPRQHDSVLMKVVRGLTRIWGDFELSASLLLERESDPRITLPPDPPQSGLLPDWERNWGLPDQCYATPQLVDLRQQALVARMTIEGAQSREFFIKIAKDIGYTITISEYRPFFIAMDGCGDCRVEGVGATSDEPMRNEWHQVIMDANGDAPVANGELSGWPNYGIGGVPYVDGMPADPAEANGPTTRYYWTVHVHEAGLQWFRCASGRCGVNPHLTIDFAEDLECLLNRWKPAHTQIIFDYSNLETGGEMAGTP